MSGGDDHRKGLMLTVLGVLILTPDTLLIRLIAIDPWSMMVWRGILQTIGILVILALIYRADTWHRCKAIGLSGLFAGCMFTASTLGFLYSVEHTSVANTLVILATAPFFAAIFSYLFLKEHVARRTVIATAVAVGGVGIMVAGSWGGGAFMGDLAALVTAALLGGKFTIFRHRKDVNMVPSMAVSGVVAALVGLAVGAPALVDGERLLYLLIMGLVVVPVSIALISLGPRYISAPETSLIMLLETALGPLWVWLVLAEVPPTLTFIGGAIVLGTLLLHSWIGLRGERTPAPSLAA